MTTNNTYNNQYKNYLVEHDFNLPNRSNELSSIESKIDKLKDDVTFIIKKKTPLTDKSYEELFDKIVRALECVGELSKDVFDIESDVEQFYFPIYKHDPKLVKRVWYEHYSNLHKPYTILKNRCYAVLSDLKKYKNGTLIM